jgi:M6 family metalloprotease-like protein
MRLHFLILSMLSFCSFSGYCAPVWNEPYDLQQPDGSLVKVLVWGDEFYQNVESLDGLSLVRDAVTGYICYARLSDDGKELLSTGIRCGAKGGLSKPKETLGIRAHLRISGESELEKRKAVYRELHQDTYENSMRKFLAVASPAAPATKVDTIYGLTILVDFPDQQTQVPRDSIVNWLNTPGYAGYKNKGSVRDFYYDMSAGALEYRQQISTFVTAKNNKTYYDAGTGYGGSTTLINEICATFKAQGGFDFTKLTMSSGTIRAVNILYAGSPAAGWANGLWPHSGSLRFTFATGVAMNAHMLSNIGTSLTLNTICHENGHMICGFPDLYAFDGHSNGAGSYDVMCASVSATNPLPFGAFLRSLKGWMQVTDITSDAKGKTYKIPVNSTIAYTWSGSLTGSTQELFCIEARRRTGRSAQLPDSGLLIWHIDKAGNNTTAGKNDYAVPEQADGKFDLENKTNMGNAGDLFRSNNKTGFNDSTVPSSVWHNSARSGITIANVSNVKDTMTFSLGNNLTKQNDDLRDTKRLAGFIAATHSGVRYLVPATADGDRPWVTLRLYRFNGQLAKTLVNGPQAAGKTYWVSINDYIENKKDLPPGNYLCILGVCGTTAIVHVSFL